MEFSVKIYSSNLKFWLKQPAVMAIKIRIIVIGLKNTKLGD
jgi:hypothetical protein